MIVCRSRAAPISPTMPSNIPRIVRALPPSSKIRRTPKPFHTISYAPKRRAPPLPDVTVNEPADAPYDRDGRADAADRLWRELVEKVEAARDC